MLVLHPAVPAKTVRELIALARAQPGKLNYASAGNGNATHLAGELFNQLARVQTVHIPYKGGGAARTELLGGQVDFMFHNITAVLPDVRGGKLRALAVTGPHRASAAPELPTMSESGLAGYEITAWYALLAPARTAPEIVGRLQKEAAAAVSRGDVRTRLAALGSEGVGSSPQQLSGHVQAEIARWSTLIKSAGLKLE